MDKGQYARVFNRFRPTSKFDESMLISLNGNNYCVSFLNDGTGTNEEINYKSFSTIILPFQTNRSGISKSTLDCELIH